ncbi:hypothetical protein [Streptomyces sp. N50]|uniref:hypothetical protein n=1 Tax=Streptomyces sp. N50 TaxID=3081765 RepID=UPI002961F791|nr:hypothetical protein [Streptomyces sp. N50]WOX10695.1 hypothetical protein R2B38_18425 [Streptomyces sp. N50]
MTALATAPTAHPRPARPWRSVLRLQRGLVIVWSMLFTAAAGALLWAYGPGGNAAAADWKRKCGPHGCDWSAPITNYHLARAAAEFLIGITPYVAAAAAGALIGRELENDTARLAWTQSVSPTRWLATSLAVPAALLTAGTTVLVLLHRLLYDAHQVPVTWHWWSDGTFDANGTIALAYPLLGLALGALAALVLRRTVAALGLAAIAMALVHAVLGVARPHLWPWVTRTGSVSTGYNAPPNVLLGDQGAITATGAHVSDTYFTDRVCAKAFDVTGYYVDYHPASHFWPLQLMETGIVLATAALVLATAFTLLRRRTA